MLPSNGRLVKEKHNLHMNMEELGVLLRYLKERHDVKAFVMVLTHAILGLRSVELLNLAIWDFHDHYTRLDYRAAKTNKIFRNEPVPEPLAKVIIAYIWHNSHRMIDGYLFPGKCGKPYKTSAYNALWNRWRKDLILIRPSFGDKYPVYDADGHFMRWQYRISSHSLRRLHRTVLYRNIRDLYIVQQLCNYSDYKTLERYINEQDIILRRDEYLLPIFGPMTERLLGEAKGQKLLTAF